MSREVIDDALALMDALQQPIDRLDQEVRRRAKASPEGQGPDAAPGRGDVHRAGAARRDRRHHPIASARKLASWAGLTPTVRGSDRTVHHGHISKRGPTWVRWAACEAAQTAKRHSDFAPGYEAIARRRGRKIATTAVARKLVTRAYHLLTEAASDGAPS